MKVMTPGGGWVPDADAKEREELQRFLSTLYVCLGMDFRGYHPEAMRRRVWTMVQKEGLSSIQQLHDRLLTDPDCANRLLPDCSVSVTSLFREPAFWRTFRSEVVPLLRALPQIRVWHAGCATGEEAYSMAILLHEEGLLERAQIHATDIDEAALQSAAAGLLALARMREYTTSYIQAGGRADFSSYYSARHGAAFWRSWLRRRVLFARHNLTAGSLPGTFDVILCRNVLIYFGADLQARTYELFQAGLAPGGVLGLGEREWLPTSLLEARFEPLDARQPLYRKRLPAP